MAGAALQLINFEGDPRGRRYTPEDREYAYLTWRVVGRRSLAKTGEMIGIAENTLRSWARDDGWRDRSDREDRDAAELARQSLATLATNEVVKSLEVVTQLRDDLSTPAKTRLDAAIYVLGLWGVAPVKVGEVTVRPDDSGQRAMPDITNTSGLTNQQLMLAEQAIRHGSDWGPFFSSLTEAQFKEMEVANGRR